MTIQRHPRLSRRASSIVFLESDRMDRSTDGPNAPIRESIKNFVYAVSYYIYNYSTRSTKFYVIPYVIASDITTLLLPKFYTLAKTKSSQAWRNRSVPPDLFIAYPHYTIFEKTYWRSGKVPGGQRKLRFDDAALSHANFPIFERNSKSNDFDKLFYGSVSQSL